MITFRVDEKGTYLSKKDFGEFSNLLWTTDSLVKTLMNGEFKNKENVMKMMHSFFNDETRWNLKIILNDNINKNIGKLICGYGFAEDNLTIIPIIMYSDAEHRVNFATLNHDLDNNTTTIAKIQLVDGDVIGTLSDCEAMLEVTGWEWDCNEGEDHAEPCDGHCRCYHDECNEYNDLAEDDEEDPDVENDLQDGDRLDVEIHSLETQLTDILEHYGDIYKRYKELLNRNKK